MICCCASIVPLLIQTLVTEDTGECETTLAWKIARPLPKAPFHFIGRPIGLGPGARGVCPEKWSEKASSERPRTLSWTSERLPPIEKMSPIGLGHPTYQPIKLSSTDYLATFTFPVSLGSLEREIHLISRQYSLDEQHEVALEGEAKCRI